MPLKRLFAVMTAAAMAALAAAAVDLPWVYDSSERTVVEVKSVAAANFADDFASMFGHWSYTSNVSHLRTVKWKGLTVIFR